MTVTRPLPQGRLDYELQVRAWTGADLARFAGISEATVSRARRGSPIGRRAIAIARALKVHPRIPELVELYKERAS